MKKEIDGIVYDTEKMYEICSYWPMWGRGNYSILYREEKDKGAFIYEYGICDMDECRDIESVKKFQADHKDEIKTVVETKYYTSKAYVVVMKDGYDYMFYAI